jgi:hypothetical protein
MWPIAHAILIMVDIGHGLLFFLKKMSVFMRRFFDAFCDYLVYSMRRINRVGKQRTAPLELVGVLNW